MTFKLDTSGRVVGNLGLPTVQIDLGWSDLSPFEQGYVEAVFAEFDPAPPEGTIRAPRPFGFSDLAPETLAAIRKDCAVGVDLPFMMGRAYNANSAGGACFWFDRQNGTMPKFPPLTPSLGDDGKVCLRRAT